MVRSNPPLRGVYAAHALQLHVKSHAVFKTPQLIARLSRAVASGPVGPVFTGPPLFSEHALHARLAEPRLLGKAWLRDSRLHGAC